MALTRPSWGQKSAWRIYNLADGLPESACVSVTAAQGKVVVSHFRQPFISELDGYGINLVPAPENAVGRVYESPGGQLWTVTREGLAEFEEGAWVVKPVPEIASAFRGALPRSIDPIPLLPARQGVVIFLLPDKLMEFNSDDPEHPPRIRILRSSLAGMDGTISSAARRWSYQTCANALQMVSFRESQPGCAAV